MEETYNVSVMKLPEKVCALTVHAHKQQFCLERTAFNSPEHITHRAPVLYLHPAPFIQSAAVAAMGRKHFDLNQHPPLS